MAKIYLAFVFSMAFCFATLGIVGCKANDVEVDMALSDGGADAAFATAIVCGPGVEASLSAEGVVAVEDEAALDLRYAAIKAPLGSSLGKLKIACAEDIVPEGYLALGPSVSYSAAKQSRGTPLRFTLPFKEGRLPEGAQPGALVVIAKRGAEVMTLPLVNPATLLGASATLSFDFDELASFQVGVRSTAGKKIKQRFTYRAIVGFSMGGGAAAVIGLRHPELFDVIGPLGGEPGMDFHYFSDLLERSILAGFCTVEEQAAGTGDVGQLCPSPRKMLDDQYELSMDFENMLYQAGQGVGLNLTRATYTRAVRDLIRAYGNGIYANAAHAFLPPGLPEDFLDQGSETCGAPVTVEGLYDREYNPQGTLKAISFCDGNDSSAKGLGIFDGALKQTTPMQVLLAYDLNENGKRDSGEPVIVHLREPFSDVGVDGKASADEAGYDALDNPDPAGDDYHYLHNPKGKEGNAQYDVGEPYEDVGVDGVAQTCQATEGGACYDYGEGNGQHDLSPMASRWIEHDPTTLYLNLPPAERERLTIWADAGIRDFLNSHVSTNQFAGRLAGIGQPLRIYDSFEKLLGDQQVQFYDFNQVDWDNVGKNVYLRYGDPKMPSAEVEQTGDGRHVGTALQIANRTTSFFALLQNRWPDGDRETENAEVSGDHFLKNLTFTSESTAQDRLFSLFLPPGYFEEINKDRRYPVVYFLHGYGQESEDLIALSGLFANYMVSKTVSEDRRFQKFIIVYVDGRCRPGGNIPLASDGDRCERGTFYVDTPVEKSTSKMETVMLELISHIDQTYRTKAPADVEVTSY